MEQFLRVGVVTKPHGVHGEVKVFPTTDEPARFKKLKSVLLDDGKTKTEVKITSVKFFKNLVILKFEGFNNMNDVEKLRNVDLLVTRDQAIPLEEGQYYLADLVGLAAISDEGEDLGIVKEILQTGANDVYVLGGKGKAEILVPAIPSCIKEINLEEGKMIIHLLPGLRDE